MTRFLLRGLDASSLLGVLLALGLFAVLALMASGVALVAAVVTAASP